MQVIWLSNNSQELDQVIISSREQLLYILTSCLEGYQIFNFFKEIVYMKSLIWIADLKNEPYRRADAVRRSQRRRVENLVQVPMGRNDTMFWTFKQHWAWV